MSGAQGVLAINIGVAVLFAAGYAILAGTNRSQRAAFGFTVSYLIGMVSPISDLLSPIVRQPELMEWLSYTSFLAATLSISATFSLFHKRPAPWIPIAAVFAMGVALRAWIWTAPRDTLAHGMAYQLPFLLAALLAMHSVLRVSRGRPLHLALAAVFAVIAANFLTKPFLAVALGAGRTLSDYTLTTYAMVSQASSGLLLLAAGLVLTLIVAQKAIAQSQRASEIDPLSGLLNRRGFDRRADLALARATQGGLPVAAAMFDLDHFKRVNDTHGHATGDAVIAAFAGVLQRTAPASALVGRLGGEEFVLLMEGATAQSAWLAAEAVRLHTAQGLGADLPPMTVSAGVAQLRTGEPLSDLLRRADHAAYDAKTAGRDRVCQAHEAEAQSSSDRRTQDRRRAPAKARAH